MEERASHELHFILLGFNAFYAGIVGNVVTKNSFKGRKVLTEALLKLHNPYTP